MLILRSRWETTGENGKIERCIRTITDRLRANKRIVLEKDKTGLSVILFSSPTAREHKAQSRAEVPLGRQHIIIGNLLKASSNSISEDNPIFKLKLEMNEFPQDVDSTILTRERARGSKLEPAFSRQWGRILSESQQTLSLLPAGMANARLHSKCDVEHARQQTDKLPPPREQNRRREITNRSTDTVIDEQTSNVQE